MAASPTLIRQLTPTGDKSQVVRLMDVFVFGPLMIQASRSQEKNYFRTALFLIGIGTILYNGVNYLETRRKEQQADQVGDQLAGLGQRVAPNPRYMPHVHTASCPEGYPVAPGACVRPRRRMS